MENTLRLITSWWLNELAPVSGVLRAVFYAGLLTLCIFDTPSPLQAAKIINGVESALYTPVKALRLLGLQWVRPEALSIVIKLTIAAWIAAAAGFAQPVSGVLTFLGFAFLHMVNAGALGANHSTHSALYALLCMCFSASYDFSLDGLLARHMHWPLLIPERSAFTSGFAPLLLLIFLSYTLFAGGVSKLLNGGLRWLNGGALRFYIDQATPNARWPFLSRLLVGSPTLCRMLAWSSLLVELLAPLAVWSDRLRVPLVASWICLHVGILCVMMPAYWVQMWCYVLLIVPALVQHSPVATDVAGADIFTLIGLLACAMLVAVLVRQSEEWPFTVVPMYSNGLPADVVRPPDQFQLTELAVLALRGRHRAWQRAWVAEEVMEDILAYPADGSERRSVFGLMEENKPAKFVRWSQYAKVVRTTALADLGAKSADGAELCASGPDYPASRLLHEVARVMRHALPDWQLYDRIELVCRTDSGGVAIASRLLNSPKERTS